MAQYNVVLVDMGGFDIAADLVDGLNMAKARARYFLTDEYARHIGTTHEALDTCKAEVRKEGSDECFWDVFRILPTPDYEALARKAGWIAESEYNGENDGVRSANGENWAEHWRGACEQDGLI